MLKIFLQTQTNEKAIEYLQPCPIQRRRNFLFNISQAELDIRHILMRYLTSLS